MKNSLLLVSLLAGPGAFAQLATTDVHTPIEVFHLRNDIPALREGFTQMKIRTPELNGSLITWYDLNIGVSGKAITSTGFANINPANPLVDELRSTGSMNGNTYTALVEMDDQGTWGPSERQTIYFDDNGVDTLWISEEYVNDEYVYASRLKPKYGSAGEYNGYVLYRYQDDEWVPYMERSISYNGNERAADTTYLIVDGSQEFYASHRYTYAGGRLDSIVMNGYNSQSGQFEFGSAMKLILGSDGGADQVLTYISNASGVVLESRADFTGGTVTGISEAASDLFSVYPVPANDVLHINMKEAGAVEVQLFDIQGRRLMSQTFSSNPEISTAGLGSGVYILDIRSASGARSQKKIIVNH